MTSLVIDRKLTLFFGRGQSTSPLRKRVQRCRPQGPVRFAVAEAPSAAAGPEPGPRFQLAGSILLPSGAQFFSFLLGKGFPSNLGPPVVLFYPFLGEGSPTKIDYRRKTEKRRKQQNLFQPLCWRTKKSSNKKRCPFFSQGNPLGSQRPSKILCHGDQCFP